MDDDNDAAVGAESEHAADEGAPSVGIGLLDSAAGDVAQPVGPGLAILVARVYLPFALGYFLSYLYRSVNAILAPNVVADVGVGAASLGLLTSAYFLAFALVQLPMGVALDRFGPRRVETMLLMVAACGAGVFGASGSLAGLIVGRTLIGGASRWR